MDLKNLIIGTLLSGLFIVMLIGFGIGFAESNNTNVSIEDDDEIANIYKSVNDSLIGKQSEMEGNFDTLTSSAPNEESDIGIVEGIRVVLKLPSMMWDIMKFLLGSIGKIIRVAPVVTYVIGAIIILSLILGAWSLIRVGR